MKTLHLIAVGLMLPLAAVSGPPNVIHERQDLMENMKDEALRPMVGMARGEAEFDADAVTAGLKVMANVADTAGDLFPEGSQSGHDTEALPEIWSDREGFDRRLADFGDAVAQARAHPPQSVEALKTSLNDILNTCKGCHDNYRLDDESR